MTYVEPQWKWYVVEIVSEARVDNDPRTVAIIEATLMKADSPEEAYAKALELVEDSEFVYRNSDGVPVHVQTLGIHQLDNLQVTTLEDGTTVGHRLLTNLPDLMTLVRSKDEMSLFGKPPYDGPNISQ